MTMLYVFSALGLFILSFFVAKEFHSIAIDKGYSESKYFWWSWLLGPAGWAMVIALPKIRTEKTSDIYETLVKLSCLHDDGALSDEEYKKMKADCLRRI